MATGMAIHVGLNNVDPDAYEGWDGELAACENDATSMEELTSALGYETQLLLTADATAEAVFGAIGDAASTLSDGDICVITYAGHGGQFDDLDSEEEDAKDETWLLFDREVLDDEIHEALAGFSDGVRIVVLSDSCHSGTVVRAFYRAAIKDTTVSRAYTRVAPKLRSRSASEADRVLRLRGAPADLQKKVLAKHRAFYEGVRARTARAGELDIAASIILVSGCQDNQESAEQNGHGAFTAALLQEWGNGSFSGDYPALHSAVQADLPATQSPNYMTDGAYRPEFEAQVPFTIDAPSAEGEEPTEPTEEPTEEPTYGTGGLPAVTGPDVPVSRADSAPSFTVSSGDNPYYIFEITADPDLFDSDRADERGEDTWYSSWDDPDAPVRLEGDLYWLPEPAWENLRGNDRLWFRIGTTPAEDSWDGYSVSTADDDGVNAPSLEIVSAAERQALRARARAMQPI